MAIYTTLFYTTSSSIKKSPSLQKPSSPMPHILEDPILAVCTSFESPKWDLMRQALINAHRGDQPTPHPTSGNLILLLTLHCTFCTFCVFYCPKTIFERVNGMSFCASNKRKKKKTSHPPLKNGFKTMSKANIKYSWCRRGHTTHKGLLRSWDQL